MQDIYIKEHLRLGQKMILAINLISHAPEWFKSEKYICLTYTS